MNKDKIWPPTLRGAMGGAIGGLIFFVYLGFRSEMFQTETRHDQAYMVMYIAYFLLPLVLLSALMGAIVGISVSYLPRSNGNQPSLTKRLLVGIFLGLIVGSFLTLYLGSSDRTFEYWIDFATLVLFSRLPLEA